MTILTTVTEIEDRVVETLRDLQRPVIDYVRKGVERAEGRIPRPTYPTNLPRPTEIIDSQVEFAKALIDVQRDFAREFVDAVAPLVEPETGSPASGPVVTTAGSTATTSTKARKPASRKAPSKKKA